MLRKLSVSVILFLSIIVLFISVVPGAEKPSGDFFKEQAERIKNIRTPLVEEETQTGHKTYDGNPSSLGFDGITSLSPGMQVGLTTYDMQSCNRSNRMVDWRTNQMVHMTWTVQRDSSHDGNRGTAYNVWDPIEAELSMGSEGCDMNCRAGEGFDYTGFPWLDVDTEGKVVISNHGEGYDHHNDYIGKMTRLHYDFAAGACFFSPYLSRLPDSTSQYGVSAEDIAGGNWRFLWPSIEYQVNGGDTITHVFARQWITDNVRGALIHYFRRIGSDTLGYWDYPPVVIDTVPTISQTVTSSRISGRVALVWQAPPGAYPGDTESMTRNAPDPGLGSNERANDVFYMISNDMGSTWGLKNNVSTFDSTVGGWLGQGDLSCLLDSDDKLHILWPARQVIPAPSGLGEFTHFWGACLLHWDELNNYITLVADANWDLPDGSCTGGSWNETAIVKPMISECDGKFYAFYVQFHDIYSGIYDDCHEDAFTGDGSSWQGTANGEIYMTISNNGGFTWDLPKNLTNTYTPHCQEGVLECESDHYVSVSRYGMQVTTGDFTGVEIVDPSVGYTGDYYIDVTYINDKYPGSCVYDAGVWTNNPVKWFRVPCIEPGNDCRLTAWPWQIGDPTWTQAGVQKDTVITLRNIGNANVTISSILPIEYDHFGWLGLGTNGPVTIESGTNNTFELDVYLNHNGVVTQSPAILEGYIEITIDPPCASVDSLPVRLIIIDTIQPPAFANIRTECTRITFSNNGNIGHAGWGKYNMDFFDDCDTTANWLGEDDNVGIYLYEASPFVLRINESGDTALSLAINDASWLSENGFRQLESPVVDSTSYPDYQYAYTGKFVTQDSAIAVEVEYFAPTDPDTCNFIVMRQRFYNNTDEEIYDVYVGDLLDWDVPSDSGVANGSDYDAEGGENSRDLMYCFGGEYGADLIENNDCILADQRMGGMAYYNGFNARAFYAEEDSLDNPRGPWWSHMNADWVYPTGNFVGSELWLKMENMGQAWETWEATAEGTTNPDSMYQDLHMVAVMGKFDLTMIDTLVFVKILASTYAGENDLKDNIDKARAWIAARPEIFTWPEFMGDCCNVPGDVNNTGTVNIIDITFLISYLYKGGPAPPCLNEADTNADCVINVLDITRLICWLYSIGICFPPVCGCVE